MKKDIEADDTSFSLARMGELQQGQFGAAIDVAIAKCIEDIHLAPFETGKRKMTITLELEPSEWDSSFVIGVKVSGAIAVATPKRTTSAYTMPLKRKPLVGGGIGLSLEMPQQQDALFSEVKGN
jgi:hypothetical protein